MEKKRSAKKEDPQKKPGVKTGQVIDVPVTTLDEDGFSRGNHDGRTVVVSGVLPNEVARVKVNHTGRREIFAELVKILRHAPERLRTPPCGKAGLCDGCPLILANYPYQLKWKGEQLLREIRRYRSLEGANIHDVAPSPKPLHYRNSAKLVVAGKHAAPVIGIYQRHSHKVIDIGECPLHQPLINRTVQAIREGINKGKVPIYSPKTGNGLLRYVVIRVSEQSSRAMVVFVTATRSFNEIHHLAKYIQGAVPEIGVIAQNINNSTGNVILGEKDVFITKERFLVDSIGEICFSISPRSFFQVNSHGARIIYEKVLEWAGLTDRDRVIDLYCGVGGISLFLAGKAKEVLGIEVVEAAAEDAEKNARLNGIRNCSFEAGDAAHILEELKERKERFDLVVLNPPRRGCDERVLRSVAAIGPARIIYVSCSPATLARDLDMLAEQGYRLLEIQPLDMFPQTTHVESVALLVRS